MVGFAEAGKSVPLLDNRGIIKRGGSSKLRQDHKKVKVIGLDNILKIVNQSGRIRNMGP